MKEVINTIKSIVDHSKKKGIFEARRVRQLEYWIEEEVKNIITSNLMKKMSNSANISTYSKKVIKNEISMYEVIEKIMKDLEN